MAKPSLSTEERARLYNIEFGQRYKGSVLHWVDNGKCISGVWMLGNNYRGSGFYGAYPPQYLKRLAALFPDAKDVMHLFSGSLPKGDYVRVDCQGEKAEYIIDAHKLSLHFHKETFGLIYADPPYTKEDAKRYGLPMPNRKKVLEQCSAVLKPGGFVVWLDTVWPMIAKKHLVLVGAIGIMRSQNHRGRFCFIMKKLPRDIQFSDL